MDQVIHRTQTYCVPGRSIVDNVSLIREHLEVSGSLGFDAGLVFLDQEEAFHCNLLKLIVVCINLLK